MNSTTPPKTEDPEELWTRRLVAGGMAIGLLLLLVLVILLCWYLRRTKQLVKRTCKQPEAAAAISNDAVVDKTIAKSKQKHNPVPYTNKHAAKEAEEVVHSQNDGLSDMTVSRRSSPSPQSLHAKETLAVQRKQQPSSNHRQAPLKTISAIVSCPESTGINLAIKEVKRDGTSRTVQLAIPPARRRHEQSLDDSIQDVSGNAIEYSTMC